MTRVVILVAGGQYLSARFPSEAEAIVFIANWRDAQAATPDGVISAVYASTTGGWAVSAKYILGMYIPEDIPTAQERIATGFEKFVKNETQGEEWKT